MSASLKVGFFGGMANNCYMVCEQMRKLGIDAVLIRDRLDNYAISQPMWQDCRFSLGYNDLIASSSWTPERWDELAAVHGWVQPDWIIDPLHCANEISPDFSSLKDIGLHVYTPAPADHYRKILAIMGECDLVFVSNVHAIILAQLSGKPFVICPAGGELMIASGIIRGEQDVGRTLDLQRRILVTAFSQTRAVLTNTAFLHHRSLTGGVLGLLRNFKPRKFCRVSLPFRNEPLLTREAQRALLDGLLTKLHCNTVATQFTVFVPSRIDYFWKGQDRLLTAIDLMRHADQFTFIFTGWGADYPKLKAWSIERSNIRVLSRALSKSLLQDFYKACDLTVDQFTLGHIGSAAREAGAAGAPVMAWIESSWFSLTRKRPEFPVLNARTPVEIAQHLDDIASGSTDLDEQRTRTQAWINQYSSPELMKEALMRCAAA